MYVCMYVHICTSLYNGNHELITLYVNSTNGVIVIIILKFCRLQCGS